MDLKVSICEDETINNSIVSNTSSSILSPKEYGSSNNKKFAFKSIELSKKSKSVLPHKVTLLKTCKNSSCGVTPGPSADPDVVSTPILSASRHQEIEDWLQNNYPEASPDKCASVNDISRLSISLSAGDSSLDMTSASCDTRRCKTEPPTRRMGHEVRQCKTQLRGKHNMNSCRDGSESDSDDNFEEFIRTQHQKREEKIKPVIVELSSSDFIDDDSIDTSFTYYQNVLASEVKKSAIKDPSGLLSLTVSSTDINLQALAKRLSFDSEDSNVEVEVSSEKSENSSLSSHSSYSVEEDEEDNIDCVSVYSSEDDSNNDKRSQITSCSRKDDERYRRSLNKSYSPENNETKHDLSSISISSKEEDMNLHETTCCTATSSDSEEDVKLLETTRCIATSSDSEEVNDSSISDDEHKLPDVSKILVNKKVTKNYEVTKKSVSKNRTVKYVGTSSPSLSFLQSLSEHVPLEKAHPDARHYKQNFTRIRDELYQKLYKLFNERVFRNQLPQDMNMTWNSRMRETAGFCYNSEKINSSRERIRSARIALSTKVVVSTERLRDTLIHELCHAGAWLINGYKKGHMSYWKMWADTAMSIFPELPPVARCHSYQIFKKFTYRCKECGYCISRHSKSLDLSRKRCGLCRGRFELLINVPNKNGTIAQTSKQRSPKGFALYVKENYQNVKKSNKDLKHGDVMKLLGSQFTAIKLGQ